MADNSIIRLLKHYFLKLKSFLFSKDVLSFLLFVVLASAFWFVNALDKERETEINIPVRFAGLPQNISVTNDLPSEILVVVKDQGKHLFGYSRANITALTIDLSRTFYEKGEIIITPDQIRGKLSRFLLPSTEILEIKPDSLLIQYEKLSVKTLPIEFVSSLELAHQYVLSDDIHLSPAKITVFGPQSVLDKLKVIKTETVELKNLSDSVTLNCKLQPVKSVKFAANETKVNIFVEMFTEKKMQLPVTVINCPAFITVRTFPAFVNVVLNVGMSHFNSVHPDDIAVIFDYNEMVNGAAKQKLKINNKTSYISNVRIEPSEIEYIMEMK